MADSKKTGTSLEIDDVELNLAGGGKVTLSYQMNLIMLHGEFISAQWSPDNVGIEICTLSQKETVKVGFHQTSSQPAQHYQSWYFIKEDELKLTFFFKTLGFPCH